MIPEVLNFPFANSGKRSLSDALRDLIIEAPRGNVLCAIAAGVISARFMLLAQSKLRLWLADQSLSLLGARGRKLALNSVISPPIILPNTKFGL